VKTNTLHQEISSGGSAANAIHGLARLGNFTAFIGKTGPDYLGKIFHRDMINSGISPMLIPSTETGTAVAFISPDSERTFAVFLGAALELSASDLIENYFEGFDVLHIEGYLVQNHELIETAVKMAKAAGLKVSLDLASYNVVEANL
jgi:sugar/nucleoside kinase (ribokinase family)